LQELTARLLPSLWQAGSPDIFAKTWQTACSIPVASGKP
jgi:hypothetical protein